MNVPRRSWTPSFYLLILLSLLACAPARQAPPPIGQEPLSIDVSDEYNDGKQLSVLAIVRAGTRVPLKDVLLRLTGLANGQVVRSQDYRLSRDNADQSALSPGEERRLALFLESEGLTDYQLEMLWGESAYKVRARPNPSPEAAKEKALRLRNLVVQRIRVPCNREFCAMKFRIRGEMLNEGGAALDHILVGVSIASAGGGASEVVSEEVSLEVAAANLQPGEVRPLVIDIDREIPEQQIEAYTPRVRIIEFR